MNKKQYQKITLQELIAKKEQRLAAKAKPKTIDCYVESLGGTVTLQAPSVEAVSDALKMGEDGGNAYTVYQCCVEPNLKDPELREAYGAADPVEIVDLIFEPGEVAALSIECMKLAGYGDGSVKPLDTLKN